MSGYPVIETENLILRVPEASDLDGWTIMNSDVETMRFIGGVSSRADRPNCRRLSRVPASMCGDRAPISGGRGGRRPVCRGI